jgi:hypothetical protein
VVNLSLEAIPLNIQRIRNTLQQLPPPLLATLPALNKAQSLGALPLQRRASEDGGSSTTSGTGGYRKGGVKGAAGCGGSSAGGGLRGPGMSRVEEWLLSSSRQEAGTAARGVGSTAAGVVAAEEEEEGEAEEADAAAVIHSVADGSGMGWDSSKGRQQQPPAGLRRRVRATQ